MDARKSLTHVLILIGALSAAAAGLLGACSRPEAPPPTPATAPAATTPPATAAAPRRDDAALRKLDDLETRGMQAEKDMDHGRLLQVADALRRLEFESAAPALRRDLLAEKFGGQAIILRDALHRFLFVELAPLPPALRQKLLDEADRGDADTLAGAAAALAEHEFRLGRRYLRATVQLRPGTSDPLWQLPVRRAGDVKRPWQEAFNEAFNQRMRGLTGRPATAPRGAPGQA